jgi:hypothetical protein
MCPSNQFFRSESRRPYSTATHCCVTDSGYVLSLFQEENDAATIDIVIPELFRTP